MARPPPVTAKGGAPAATPRRPVRRRPIGLAPLRGFEAAARLLSFTRAADELHLTQSAVSRQIAALEDDLGYQLFVRKTRELLLTPSGAQLARTVRQALGVVDRSVEEIRGQGASPRVVITTYPSFASLWLVPRLAAFQRAHPGIEIRIDAQGRRVDLEAEGVDIALRRCPPQDAPADAIRVLDEDTTPALSPELLNRHGGRLQSPADLVQLPRIEMEDDLPSTPRSDWSRWLEVAGVSAEEWAGSAVMAVTYIDQAMQGAARGQGVVLAGNPFREDMVASGQLVLPFPNIRFVTGFSMFLIVSQLSRDRAAVAQLRDWLLQEFARPPARRG